MQLELQSRLQSGVPHHAPSCSAPGNLGPSTLVDHPPTCAFSKAPHIQDKAIGADHYEHLPFSCLINAEQDQVGRTRTDNKSGLIFTEVGQGQFVCTGVPRMMAFGCPLQLLPVNVEWPLVPADPPVRTLHGHMSPLKTENRTTDKISYVVPVNVPAASKQHTASRLKSNSSKLTGDQNEL